ncbi:AAA family ATPase [Pseudanabaena sp. FACHB-1998]|uniref:AAA family ATPase n=1 Tax=Pseudanabaena sp. FACHB-1998 TaxID=2692858 RepID=UPI001680C507|nr:AAA family ATPase [Pseudanabaena sp. FACHB-1998]MBD2179419.1 AAA family ATPase [Pseudanabaena sp. FACHB-1998]
MSQSPIIQVLPYTRIVGQKDLKLALELAYIAPRIGGVLISGQRGTGKSTAVRAFAQMMRGQLPVTLPINATEDRVVGGWKIDELMKGKPDWQDGLLVEADRKGLLYVDEVNLLDDHIVNIILDVTSTGVLVIQREGKSEEVSLAFTLVGTMNPEEGGLRPQLLDRFGLMVGVTTETELDQRREILNTVLAFDEVWSELRDHPDVALPYLLKNAKAEDEAYKQDLLEAKSIFYEVALPNNVVESCVNLTKAFEVQGNRGDYVLALAARAYAALKGAKRATQNHVWAVAEMALQHRRPEVSQGNDVTWTSADSEKVASVLGL